MENFLTFHEVTFDIKNIGIKKLFALDTQLLMGVEQVFTPFLRNPRNPNQIKLSSIPKPNEKEYTGFLTGLETFEITKDFVFSELNIESISQEIKDDNYKNKSLYFYIFEHDEDEASQKFRGILYVSTLTKKPIFFVAFNKSIEYEYEKEIYKK